MSNFSISEQDDYINITVNSGEEITVALILEILQAERGEAESWGKDVLWDMRGCFPAADFGYDALGIVIRTIQGNLVQYASHKKTALLISFGVAYGMSRMFQQMGTNLPYTIQVFTEEEKARNWLTNKNKS